MKVIAAGAQTERHGDAAPMRNFLGSGCFCYSPAIRYLVKHLRNQTRGQRELLTPRDKVTPRLRKARFVSTSRTPSPD
jgi:hypothetical protein